MGKAKFVLSLQSDLVCCVLQQDLTFYDRLHSHGGFGELRFLIEQSEMVASQLFEFPMGLIEHSIRLSGFAPNTF